MCFYSSCLAKIKKSKSVHFVSLKILNLPPRLREKKETKPLLAVIECKEDNINKYNHIIVDNILQTWESDNKIYDAAVQAWDTSNFYLMCFMNDLMATKHMMCQQSNSCINMPCKLHNSSCS